jgi:dCTP diphosphatase
LGEVRDIMRQFITERDWHKFHTPRNLLLALVGEVGELVEIYQWAG